MHPTIPTLSVVIPCHNEGDIIDPLLRNWAAACQASLDEYEIIAVNDGSLDGTGRVLDKLRRELKYVRVIHQLNSGHARALRRGAESARGTYVLFADADERYEPADFIRMWQSKQENVLVVAHRTHRVEGLLGGLASGILKKVGSWLFGVTLSDPTSSFQLFRQDVLRTYLAQIPNPTESLNCALNYLVKRDFPTDVLEMPIHYGSPKKAVKRGRPTQLLALAGRLLGDLLKARTLIPTSEPT